MAISRDTSGLTDSLVQNLGGGEAFLAHLAWASRGLVVSERP